MNKPKIDFIEWDSRLNEEAKRRGFHKELSEFTEDTLMHMYEAGNSVDAVVNGLAES